MKLHILQTPQTIHNLTHKVIPSLLLACQLHACASAPASLPGTPRTGGTVDLPLTSSILATGTTGTLVFIEGDGHAYITRTVASGNPTPLNPVGLTLARHTVPQTSATVIYAARPCMWHVPKGTCRDNTLWTERRFNPDVLTTQVSYIKELTAGTPTPVTLVGYSGGAAVALHAAVTLKQSGIPVRVITVAGNLDPTATNRFHKLSDMPEWTPTPYTLLGTIPQKHLMGAEDKIIPPQLTEQYSINLGSKCSEPTIIPAATHADGWNEAVAKALAEPFICQPQ